jgi:disulfide bond formation protein DsbB
MPQGTAAVIDTGYAVLALIADALVLLTLLAFLVSRTSPAGRDGWARFRAAISPYTLHLAWIIAMLATLGSLYESQLAHLQPCEFCWFQRICMYPLSLLLGIAAFRGEIGIAKRYFLTLSIVGAILATYHYQLEHVTGEPSVCSAAAPCSAAAFNIFGFISIPFLSLAAFLMITTLLLLSRTNDDEYEDDDIDEPVAEGPAEAAVPARA